ncbi:hypothetical protein DNTS_030298 [Danionella cerebrum]|uniref:RING-type domain-containing protein n=1 Tax=Danionella cerebrum TaxID=2873325 RepID=A0A553RJY1_9TELE|nr:hypothetical protein DNTS_030298 [Danionella translucida]
MGDESVRLMKRKSERENGKIKGTESSAANLRFFRSPSPPPLPSGRRKDEKIKEKSLGSTQAQLLRTGDKRSYLQVLLESGVSPSAERLAAWASASSPGMPKPDHASEEQMEALCSLGMEKETHTQLSVFYVILLLFFTPGPVEQCLLESFRASRGFLKDSGADVGRNKNNKALCVLPALIRMEPSTVVWHSHTILPESDLEKVSSHPECSICFNTFDNVFKTPKQLDCTHTFCLECLSRIMTTSTNPQNSKISCPFCRQPTIIPKKGPPGLTTSQEVLCRLPVHQQQEEPVWLDGERLCYQRPIDMPGMPAFCICLDIGASRQTGVSPQTRSRLGFMGRLMDWKRLMLFIFLMMLLLAVVLWPLQCIVSTGSMRCSPPNLPVSTTTAPTTPFIEVSEEILSLDDG